MTRDNYLAALDELTGVPPLVVDAARGSQPGYEARFWPQGDTVLRALRIPSAKFWSRVTRALDEHDITQLHDHHAPGYGHARVANLVTCLSNAGTGSTLTLTASQQRASKAQIIKASKGLRTALDAGTMTFASDANTGLVGVDGYRVMKLLEVAMSDRTHRFELSWTAEPCTSLEDRPAVLNRLYGVTLQDVLSLMESFIEAEPVISGHSRQRESRQRVFTRELVDWFDGQDTPTRGLCITTAAAVLRDRYPNMKLAADPLT